MSIVVFDDPQITRFIEVMVGVDSFGPGHSIGAVDPAGNPLGGFFYEGFNGVNCFAHVAGKPGGRWLSRDLLLHAVCYPFLQLGVKRVTGWVEASNTAARKLDEHLGFVEETRLKGAAKDGGDVIVYVLWKESCRFLEYSYVKRCR